MKGNLAGLLQQAQKMQENLQSAQEELANIEVKGTAGGGMVEVTMTCRHEVRRIRIDPAIGDDLEMVEDLVTAAINDAVNRVASTTQEKMAGMTAGMPLPPGFKLPM